MPLLENDVIFAYLSRGDPNHRIAEKIFAKLGKGTTTVEVSGVSLVEMELVYKSEGLDARLLEDLSAVAALPDGLAMVVVGHETAVAVADGVAVAVVLTEGIRWAERTAFPWRIGQ